MNTLFRQVSTKLFSLLLIAFLAPFSAFAGSVTASVSASSINSLGSFQVHMTSTGATSCTWSRLDNGTTWQWKDQPLPSGTAYDSGNISGWPGPASYEWQFNCSDGTGSTFFGATSISITSDTGSLVDDLGDLVASIIGSIVGLGTGPDATVIPIISVLPTPLVYPDTDTTSSNDIHLIVSNVGGSGSLLTGSVGITGDPSFTCIQNCTYANIPQGTGPDIIIRFAPATPGPKTAMVDFSGGGGISVPATGNGVVPPVVIVTTPSPIISVSPDPTLFFYGVEMNAHRDEVFTVRNTGPAGTLLTGNVSLAGSTHFTCISGCPYTNIGTTDVHTVTIRFAPLGTPGTSLGTINFSGGGNATRYVNGDGYLLLVGGALDFGDVLINQAKMRDLTITNPSLVTSLGVGTLIVPAPFACVGVCTYNLPPGGMQTFHIVFSPTVVGSATEIGILSGAPSNIFTFTGKGVRQYFKMQEQ